MLSSYETRALAALSAAFDKTEFSTYEACSALLSPYGNTCATLRGLIKAGVACEVSPKTLVLTTNKESNK
tara:strand:- start:286 stop:495 length:210 start_codon:yes stop_codon:yes gene_type:complete